MPVSWSALEVSQAMDEVEALLNDVHPTLHQALRAVDEAKQIPNLPQYMTERLARLSESLSTTIPRVRGPVISVRKALPNGAVERERAQGKTKLEL